LKRAWDSETAALIRSGLKRLMKARPQERAELEKALKGLEKEYMLRAAPNRKESIEGKRD